MKESCWQKVIVFWGNALQLREEPILDVSDLLDGSFFICLIRQLGYDCEDKVNKVTIVNKFIKDNYTSIDIKSEWDNKEVILISSLLLLTSSLEVSHLRAPLFCLDTQIQLNIQGFIQKCLSFPKHVITRELIAEAIDSIESYEEKDGHDAVESSSFISSPNSSFSPVFVSPDAKGCTMNRIKLLQNEVEVLNLDKQHLQEEIEANKQEFQQLAKKYDAQEQEILHLKNELFLQGNDRCNEHYSDTKRLKELEKIDTLVDDLAIVQAVLCMTRNELEVVSNDNQILRTKLNKEQMEKENYRQKSEETESTMIKMLANMEQMESKLTILKQTCQEQEVLLRDQGSINISDESVVINDECSIAVGTGESLASIVDIKYAELEEETKKLRKVLTDKEALIINLQELLSRQEILKLKDELLSVLDSQSINKTLIEDLEVNGLQNETLDKIKEIINLRENLRTMVATNNLQLNQLRNDVQNERFETDRQREILEAKTVRLEECTALAEKLRRNLNDRDNEIKTITESMKRAVNESAHLQTLLNLKQSEMVDMSCQLEICEARLTEKDDRIAALTSDIADRVCETEQLKEQISVYEQRLVTNMVTLKNKDAELNEVKKTLDRYKIDMDELKNQLCCKASLIAELQHDVQMCQHEKNILEKEMENLMKNVKKSESLRKELSMYEEENAKLKKQLEEEKANMKIVQDQFELEEKLNNAFDMKLTELQSKMKTQYDKELSGSIEEYKDKISQLRLKITKDKLHIQELSAELWNTTDKLLLSQQQCEALRNQLRRTKCALEILNNSAIRRHSLATSATIQRASNPCLWLNADESESNPLPILDDFFTTVNKRNWPSIDFKTPDCRRRRFSSVLETSSADNEPARDDEAEEVFNDAFLQDLKDGICRLPNENNNLQRASCPVVKPPESPINVQKVSDKQVLLPPEKPKRKGQIVYSKPGPPTPCVRAAAARLSLQNLEKPELRKLKEVNLTTMPPPTTTGPSRLSKLFATAKGQNKTKPINQDSPKIKRKSFFQRKFGSNRENLPPPS